MKFVKFILLTLTAALLTGCYTQLQHTTKSQSADNAPYQEEEEEYIPVDYKNYEYADRYEVCDCNPYRSYRSDYNAGHNYHSFYDSYWGRSHYRPYLASHYGALSPYSRWRMGIGFGSHHSFYNSFGFSFSWGSPYYHSFYGNRFYYDPYSYGYHRPFAYNYYNFYGSGYYRNVYRNDDRDRDYRRRSIGTSRVSNNDRSRTRSESTSERSRVRSRSSDTSSSSTSVRSRSTGSSRTDNGSVERTRSRSNGSGSGSVGRSRSGGNSSSGSSSGGRSRSRGDNNLQSSNDSANSEATKRQSRVGFQPETDANVVRRRSANSSQNRRQLRSSDDNERSRDGFINKLKKVFDAGKANISTDRSRSANSEAKVRSRRSTQNKPTVNRNKNQNKSRSTVRQSRSSSSSKSRSRGNSSRSRSRGN